MNESIIRDLVECLKGKAEERIVRDVRIGLSYTAVQLDDGSCGVAFTFREEAGEACTALQQSGTISGRPAKEVAGWALGVDAIATAVGVATLNALIEPPLTAVEADVRDLMQVGSDDVVGMVGYFEPLVGMITERARTLHIFERKPMEGAGIRPDSAAPILLPECDVVIVSGTTVVNHTIDGLLGHATRAREVVLLGPSTPLLPEVFQKRGVTLLSGIQVVDGDQLLRVVSEGGGTRRLGRAVRKLCVRLSAETS